MTSERARLIERLNVVRRDLAELAEQVQSGEIDDVTAGRLRQGYEEELGRIEDLVGPTQEDAGPTPEPESEPETASVAPQVRPARSPRRVVVGAVVLVGALTTAIFFAAQGAEPDPDSVGSDGPGALTVDPASVTNEQLEAVVAANPDITAMRMALADRYYEAEEWGSALDHYLYIAENTTNPAEETKALARVGWMAYITEQAEPADEYFSRALAIDPTNSEAILFRAFNTMYGLDDPAGAIPQFEAALALPNISDNVVSQIEASLEEARTAAP